jgi:hypothetical protein
MAGHMNRDEMRLLLPHTYPNRVLAIDGVEWIEEEIGPPGCVIRRYLHIGVEVGREMACKPAVKRNRLWVYRDLRAKGDGNVSVEAPAVA